jgi:hypothetical protein
MDQLRNDSDSVAEGGQLSREIGGLGFLGLYGSLRAVKSHSDIRVPTRMTQISVARLPPPEQEPVIQHLWIDIEAQISRCVQN